MQASDITVYYGEMAILNHVSLSVKRGEIVTVVGPNGSGKTTLLKVLLGLITPQQGNVARVENLVVGYVPQKLRFEPTMPMTVEWYLQLGAPKGYEAVLSSLTAPMGIARLLKHPIHKLSGGETQRVLLTRALLRKPDLLVLDEPVQGVDVSGQAQIYDLIQHMRDRFGCAVVMVSHDLHLVMAATDRVVCLNHHICCEGHPQEISNDPAFIQMFGQTVAESLAVYVHRHDHDHGLHGEVLQCGQGEHSHD